MTVLTPKAKTEWRRARLEELQSSCELCGLAILEGQAVVDHCHRQGHIRGVIHRGCNTVLGKLENASIRYRVSLADFCAGLGPYLGRYSTNVHGLIHDSFRTAEQKRERARKRARRAYAKRKSSDT